MKASRGIAAFVGMFAVISVCPQLAHAEHVARRWTVEDIATVPEIKGLVLSVDGRSAAYIVRISNIATNTRSSFLHLVDLSNGEDRVIAEAQWLENLQYNKAHRTWNVLGDFGGGVQLYEVTPHKGLRRVVFNTAPVPVGEQDGGVFMANAEAPRDVGVLSYKWSPDGSLLWYARLVPAPTQLKPISGEGVLHKLTSRRWSRSASVELRARYSDGRDVLVDTRPPEDRLALSYAGNALLTEGAVDYVVEDRNGDGLATYTAFRWHPSSGTREQLESLPKDVFSRPAIGPRGGYLSVDGYGVDAQLNETLPDSSKHSYGRVDFRINDPRSSPTWRSSDGTRTILGIRDTRRPGYGLIVLDADGFRRFRSAASLTNCAFTPTLDVGLCVRQGLSSAPELVRIDIHSGTEKSIVALAPRQAAITPLATESRIWTSVDGYTSTGFVVYPREFRRGERYPAILITHGSDADDRFADQGFQWEYPVQAFAERGYVVLLVNDPSPYQSATLMRTYDAWMGQGNLPVEQIHEGVWLSTMRGFEAAVGALVQEGIVDPGRVGIAGYSRGSQMVNVTMTQSRVFQAASSGDGGYLEPSAFHSVPDSYRRIFGGSPFESKAQQNYRRLSPTYRAAVANGPILQQVAALRLPALDLLDALKLARIPSEVTIYPGDSPSSDETHLFHIPSNRISAMEENLDWFDFWLRDSIDPAPDKAERYRRWQVLRDIACAPDRPALLPLCRH